MASCSGCGTGLRAEPLEPHLFQRVLIARHHAPHLAGQGKPRVQGHALIADRMLWIVEQPQNDGVHPLLAHLHEDGLAVVERRRMGRRLRRAAGAEHEVEFGKFLRQAHRFVHGGVGQEDEVVGLLHLGQDLLQGRPRVAHLKVVVVDLVLILFPNDAGDRDFLAAGGDDPMPRHRSGVEAEQADVGGDEGAVGRRPHLRDQHAGRQPQVGRPEGDARVARLQHRIDRRLELDFRLGAEALGDVADVEADDRPALLAQRLEEGVSPAHAALHAVHPGAAARFEVSLLPAGHHQGHLRLRPIDEDRPVLFDRVEGAVDLLLGRRRLAGPADGCHRGPHRQVGNFANGHFGPLLRRRLRRLRRGVGNRHEVGRRAGQGLQVLRRLPLPRLHAAGGSVRGSGLFAAPVSASEKPAGRTGDRG